MPSENHQLDNLSREQLTDLRQKIVDHYNDEELRTLCFDVGANYEDLPAQGKEGKARELIAYLQRLGQLPDLIKMCRKTRPKVDWSVHAGTGGSSDESLDNDNRLPPGFLPVGRWRMQLSDGSAWLMDFYPNGAFVGQGIGMWWGAGAQAAGGWGFFVPTQTLQLQGSVNNTLPIMVVIAIQGQQDNRYFGLGNDGKSYTFTRTLL